MTENGENQATNLLEDREEKERRKQKKKKKMINLF